MAETPDFSSLPPASGDAGQPKYEQLKDYVISQIETGHLKGGDALPSEHRIAESLQIARSTVRQALAALERDGFVRRVHGKGTFVHEQARQRLKKGQDLFALILPETETGFYPSLQKSVEAAAAELHSQVIVCNTGNDVDRQGNAILQLIDLNVGGVAIVPTTNPATPAFHLRQLQQHEIPVVCCSRHVEGVQAPLLALPFEEVGRRAGEALREQGHRHVGFFTGDRTVWSQAVEHGFRAALGGRGECHSFIGHSSSPQVSMLEGGLIKALEQMLAAPNPPTAIFATFDSLAELLYILLLRMAIRVPEQISILGFGGVRRYGVLANQLTSITMDEQRLGREAIDLLHRMRQGELPIDLAEMREMPLGISDGQTLKKRGPE